MRVQGLANFGLKLAAAFVLAAGCAAASAATIEVQGVCADKNTTVGVPKTLERYKHILEKTSFTAFKDCGTRQKLRVSHPGAIGVVGVHLASVFGRIRSCIANRCSS